MNYSEKYFEDEDELNQFAYDLTKYMFENLGYYEGDSINLAKTIKNFLQQQSVKPTLTEDEKVILRNIEKKYKYISRSEWDKELYLKNEADDNCKYVFRGYKHIFQFIKER